MVYSLRWLSTPGRTFIPNCMLLSTFAKFQQNFMLIRLTKSVCLILWFVLYQTVRAVSFLGQYLSRDRSMYLSLLMYLYYCLINEVTVPIRCVLFVCYRNTHLYTGLPRTVTRRWYRYLSTRVVTWIQLTTR